MYIVVKVWTAASHNRSVLPKLNMARDVHIKWEFLYYEKDGRMIDMKSHCNDVCE